MLKRWLIALLALLSLPAVALAEVYEGTTVALASVTVRAESGGTVGTVEALVGQRVDAGVTLLRLEPERTFARQDGTVSLVNAAAGESVSGNVLEIMPMERYTVYCTVDKAYKSAASTLVHSGETVYIKCTADGTHRALGIVTQIDGSEYRVLTLGGELYVGETVYLYRDADFTTAQRVGIGTVVVTDTQAYQAEGTLTAIRVAEGDDVERGQLLYETGGGEVVALVSGIVTSLSCQAGDAVEEEQTLAELVPEDQIGVEIRVDEEALTSIVPGASATVTLAGQEDTPLLGRVSYISSIDETGEYVVRIRVDSAVTLALGMGVEVRLG